MLNVVTENVQKFLIGHDTEPCRSLVANVTIINNSLQDVGKDGKLQLLLCLAVRYEILHNMMKSCFLTFNDSIV